MKKVSLFLTLGVVAFMAACNPANSGSSANEEPTSDSSVILETPTDTTTELSEEIPATTELSEEIPATTELSEEVPTNEVVPESLLQESPELDAEAGSEAEGVILEEENAVIEEPSVEEAADAESTIPLENVEEPAQ